MIRIETEGDVAVLWLEKGKGNSLDPDFLAAIGDGVDGLRTDPPRGLVLTAAGSAFCAGLDLVRLADLDRAGMQSVLDGLYRVVRALFAFPRPVIAAMNGHAIAGGALISLCADRRLMAQGPGKWGLSEMALGLPMPAHTLPVLQYALSRPWLEKLVYGGSIYPGFELLEMGIVERLVEPEDLLPTAFAAVEEWTTSPEVFADVKARLHAPTLAAMDAARPEDAAWLRFWFTDDARARVAAVRERLLQKKDG